MNVLLLTKICDSKYAVALETSLLKAFMNILLVCGQLECWLIYPLRSTHYFVQCQQPVKYHACCKRWFTKNASLHAVWVMHQASGL